MYTKYTDGDQVAVIVHEAYGTGWYTNHGQEDMLFHAELARALESDDNQLAAAIIHQELRVPFWYGNPTLDKIARYARELSIVWVPRGEKFFIHEYDGFETVWLKHKIKWIQP
jgi:hypothetical protein